MQFVWPLLSNMAIHHIPSLCSPRVQLGPQTKYPFKFRNSFRKSPRKVNFVARNIFTGRLIFLMPPLIMQWKPLTQFCLWEVEIALLCSPHEIKRKFCSCWLLPRCRREILENYIFVFLLNIEFISNDVIQFST